MSKQKITIKENKAKEYLFISKLFKKLPKRIEKEDSRNTLGKFLYDPKGRNPLCDNPFVIANLLAELYHLKRMALYY